MLSHKKLLLLSGLLTLVATGPSKAQETAKKVTALSDPLPMTAQLRQENGVGEGTRFLLIDTPELYNIIYGVDSQSRSPGIFMADSVEERAKLIQEKMREKIAAKDAALLFIAVPSERGLVEAMPLSMVYDPDAKRMHLTLELKYGKDIKGAYVPLVKGESRKFFLFAYRGFQEKTPVKLADDGEAQVRAAEITTWQIDLVTNEIDEETQKTKLYESLVLSATPEAEVSRLMANTPQAEERIRTLLTGKSFEEKSE